MSQIVFTDLSIQRLKGDASYTTFYDKALPSFGIRCGLKKKTWVLMRGEARKRVSLGTYPTVTLKVARAKALSIIDGTALLQAAQKPQERLEEYLRTLNTQTPRYNYEQKRLLERHLIPHVTDLAKVTKGDIMRLTDKLAHRHSEQLHFCRATRAFFNWLLRRDYLQTSPIPGLFASQSDRSRERVLTPWELQIICSKAVGSHGAVIHICILLGTRKSETTAIEASWIKEGNLVIPAHITKNRSEHILPLTDLALNCVEHYCTLKKPNWNSWNKDKKNTEWADSIHRVTDWTIHDLRRTFATLHAQIGTPPHIIEALLNHKSGQVSGVAKIYNRYRYLKEMREALEAYEKFLEARGIFS